MPMSQIGLPTGVPTLQASEQIPAFQQISVAGNFAVGQVTHHWSLLSNSIAWETFENVGAIVANP
jgi:hypothetical protein